MRRRKVNSDEQWMLQLRREISWMRRHGVFERVDVYDSVTGQVKRRLTRKRAYAYCKRQADAAKRKGEEPHMMFTVPARGQRESRQDYFRRTGVVPPVTAEELAADIRKSGIEFRLLNPPKSSKATRQRGLSRTDT